MRVPAGLASFLRTPRGVLALLACALVVSAAAAMACALNRDFFEGHVRERYASPSALLVELGQSLDRPEGVRRLRRLGVAERRGLYTAWIQVGDSWPPAAVRAMVAADPQTCLDAAFQTLIAGSPEQRRRAVRFLALADHPGARELLDEALARAVARREDGLASLIREALLQSPAPRGLP